MEFKNGVRKSPFSISTMCKGVKPLKNKYEIRGSVTAIFLSRRDGSVLETLIDTSDLKRAQEFPNTWCVSWSADTHSFYCYGKLKQLNGERKSVLLHRWITNCPGDKQVDHFDNDTLNNLRSTNLRISRRTENHQNRSGAQRNNSNGVRGVSWHVRRCKWQASIKVQGNRRFLGYFSDLSHAEAVVKSARRSLMPFSKEASRCGT